MAYLQAKCSVECLSCVGMRSSGMAQGEYWPDPDIRACEGGGASEKES